MAACKSMLDGATSTSAAASAADDEEAAKASNIDLSKATAPRLSSSLCLSSRQARKLRIVPSY
eukprot:6190461-Pleurochrysis_carterae.AAC.1